MTEIGNLQFGGYHGTSIGNARIIEAEGFKSDGGPVCFAPLDNLSFAQTHGRRRAEKLGDSQYGVVMASLPPTPLEFGLDGDQINVPASEVGRIIVRNVLVFEARPSGLMVPKSTDL